MSCKRKCSRRVLRVTQPLVLGALRDEPWVLLNLHQYLHWDWFDLAERWRLLGLFLERPHKRLGDEWNAGTRFVPCISSPRHMLYDFVEFYGPFPSTFGGYLHIFSTF